MITLDYLKEAMELFKELTPENQATLLSYTRVAHTSENAVKKSVTRALRGEEDVAMKSFEGEEVCGISKEKNR